VRAALQVPGSITGNLGTDQLLLLALLLEFASGASGWSSVFVNFLSVTCPRASLARASPRIFFDVYRGSDVCDHPAIPRLGV
jgi:hypothetical protein